jgi:catechol 2,3-dioxygenase-like lactoylglutathione lyase family enzyme
MLKTLGAFSGVSVNDLSKAKEFYTNVLGLTLDSEEMGLRFRIPGGGQLFIYDKADHKPADFTILNFIVENIDTSIDQLKSSGVIMEVYDNLPGPQDEKGVLRGIAAKQGPDIAWFKDPAGNVLSLLQEPN